jgi:haloalkane dehalogenase
MKSNIDLAINESRPSQPALTFIEHHIPRDGHHLYAQEYPGTGPALVLLHGFPDNLHIYDRLIPTLVATGRHVVAFDFLGFGASEKPTDYNYNFEQQRGDLEAVVEFLKLDRIVAVAHDASGVVAINYVLSNPGRVSTLCLSNTFYGHTPTLRFPELIELFATPGLSALAHAMLSDPAQVGFLLNFQLGQLQLGAPQALKDIGDTVLKPIIVDNFFQVPSAAAAFAKMTADIYPQMKFNNEHLRDLESLDLPVKVIWGERDAYLNTGVAKDFAARFKHASLHFVDAGHWLMLDLPEEVGSLLLADVLS